VVVANHAKDPKDLKLLVNPARVPANPRRVVNVALARDLRALRKFPANLAKLPANPKRVVNAALARVLKVPRVPKKLPKKLPKKVPANIKQIL